MAQELELDWWRPQETGTESSQAADAAETGEAWLPFWCIMAFTGVLLLSPQDPFLRQEFGRTR